MGSLVLKYFEDIKGNIADLFCGVGTFSYLLASKTGVKITAVDSSEQLLKGFQDSINKNQITEIKRIKMASNQEALESLRWKRKLMC